MLENGYVCSSERESPWIAVSGVDGASDVVEEEPRRDGRPLPFLPRSLLEDDFRPSNRSTSSPSLIVSKPVDRAREPRRPWVARL